MLSKRQKIYLPFKRFFDIFFSLLALLVFSPLYVVLAILVKTTSKGPVFFKQDRIGKEKKTFKILKFRTMRSDTDPNTPTHLLDNPEAHITKVGKFLRKTSLDEILQAFNILVGHMSIIGPRPALWNQDDLIAERDQRQKRSCSFFAPDHFSVPAGNITRIYWLERTTTLRLESDIAPRTLQL